MTKQEELIKGVNELIDGCYIDMGKRSIFQRQKFMNELFPYLDKQGVVIQKPIDVYATSYGGIKLYEYEPLVVKK